MLDRKGSAVACTAAVTKFKSATSARDIRHSLHTAFSRPYATPSAAPTASADVELLAAVRAAEVEMPAASRAECSESLKRGSDTPAETRSECRTPSARARETRYPEAVQQITELTLQSQAWLHDFRGTLPTRVGLARWVTH